MTLKAKPYTVFFLSCVLLLTIFSQHHGYAFYRESDKSNISSFQHERIYESWSQGIRALAVSDNYCYALGKHNQKPAVHCNSDRFVAMDLLEINLPVKTAVYRPTSLDNNLSDIFYADLKLKKLREEYKALQERARKLLAGLEVSPVVSPSEFAGTPHRDQPLEKTSVFAAKKQLMRQHSNLTKQSQSHSSLCINLQKALVANANSLRSLKRLSKGINKGSDTTVTTERLSPQYKIDLFHEETFFDELIGWLFMIPNYILSHKLEALFLLFLFILLLKLVSSVRTR